MKTAVVGGVGLFGHRVERELVARGHEVISVRPRSGVEDPQPEAGVEFRHCDPATASHEELIAAVEGAEALICALGAPSETNSDGSKNTMEAVVAVTDRALAAAVDAGVRTIVLVGSYLSTWDRMRPDLKMAENHPYVRGRNLEAEHAIVLGDERGVRVCVVETPFVFGAGEGENQRWSAILFDRVSKPFVFFPAGGTSVITSQQLAEALVGAVERGAHGERYPVSDMEMPWREMIQHIAGGLERRPIVMDPPGWATRMLTRRVVTAIKARGRLGGLTPEHLVDSVLTQYVYVDATHSREVLRYKPGGVPQAIRDTARDAYGLPLEARAPRPEFASGRRGR